MLYYLNVLALNYITPIHAIFSIRDNMDLLLTQVYFSSHIDLIMNSGLFSSSRMKPGTKYS